MGLLRQPEPRIEWGRFSSGCQIFSGRGGSIQQGTIFRWWAHRGCPSPAAYRLEDTYGPDPTMMRANCLVQTTEWSACSKTCGMGISTRVTNDNAFCRLEKQSRLCMVRPCEADLEENIKVKSLILNE